MEINYELRKYIPLVKMIAATFGKNCEVVLHDLTIPRSSVVFVVNNQVTGRMVGQSFDHLVRDVLFGKNFSDDFCANYLIPTEDGRVIKSSTSLIRNDEQKAIGALCINVDITGLQSAALELLEMTRIDSGNEPESEKRERIDHQTTNINIVKILDELIDNVLEEKKSPDMKSQDRLDIVRFFDEKGIFLVKGSVEKVAAKMGISPVTVYSYLDKIKKSK